MKFQLAAAAVVVVVGLSLSGARDHENPPVVPARMLETQVNVPWPVQDMLRRSCMDCHSNETWWPWYSNFAPVSSFIERDVERARKAMNLSEWTVNKGAARGLLAAACQGVKDGRMPPSQYRFFHPDANLQPEDSAMFCQWTRDVIQDPGH